MSRIPRLFTLSLVWCVLFVSARAAGAASPRLGRDVVPTFERIQLRLDPNQTNYSGSVRIEIEVKVRTSTIHFHAEDMTLDRVALTGGATPIALTPSVGEKGLVTAQAPAPLDPGAYVLEVDFHNDFQTDATSLYRMDYQGDKYAFTQFEADDAREAFPCWDEPEFKIPFQLVLQVPAAQVAVSNTPAESETMEDDWHTMVYQKTKPLPTYLLALAAGPLEFVPMAGLDMPAGVVTVKGQSYLADLATQMAAPLLKSLEEWFGSKYPFEQLLLIAVPEYWAGAMEHPGAITFSDQILLVDSATATVSQKRSLARVMAHEMAHMWFGDLVTMAWWDDLWLNESFADWMGDRTADRVYPEYAIALSERQNGQNIMLSDARPSTVPIRRPVETTDNLLEDVGLAYNKGKTVLAMFEQWIGPETFQKAIRAYLKDHAWGSATSADLWAALDKASGKKVSAALAGFIDQPGLPLITVELLGGNQIKLSQQRFHNLGTALPELTWQVPVALKFKDADGVHTQSVLLASPSEVITLKGNGDPIWVYPNATSAGYYRWAVPSAVLSALAADASQALAPVERVELLGNVHALLDAGALDGEGYLTALTGFASDPEPLVVSALLDQIEMVQTAFVSPELEDAYAVYVRKTFRPALERIGMEKREGESETVSILRPRLLARLGDEGRDPEVRRYAAERARIYMSDPTTLDPALVNVCLNLAAHEGGMKLFDEYRRRFETAQTPADRQRFLGALGAGEDSALWDAALRYNLEGPLRPNELFTIPRTIGETLSGQGRVFQWMIDNYAAVTKRLPPEFAAFMPMIASGCDRERLDAAKAFFSEPAHHVAGTDKQMAQVADQVTDCLTLREREGASVALYLEKAAGSE